MAEKALKMGRIETGRIKRQPEWASAAAANHPEIPSTLGNLIEDVVLERVDGLLSQQEQYIAQRAEADREIARKARQIFKGEVATQTSDTTPVANPANQLASMNAAREAWSNLPQDATTPMRAKAIARLLELVPSKKPKDIEGLVQTIIESSASQKTADAATMSALNPEALLAIVDDAEKAAVIKAAELAPRAAKAVSFQRVASVEQARGQRAMTELRKKLGAQPTEETQLQTAQPIETQVAMISVERANEIVDEIFGANISEDTRRSILARGGLQETISPITFERTQGVTADGMLAQIASATDRYNAGVATIRATRTSQVSPTELLTATQEIIAAANAREALQSALVRTPKEAVPSQASLLTIEDFEEALKSTGEGIDGIELLFKEPAGSDLVFTMVSEQLANVGITDPARITAVIDLLTKAFEPRPLFDFSSFQSIPQLTGRKTTLQLTKEQLTDEYITSAQEALATSEETRALAELVTAAREGSLQEGSAPARIDMIVDALFTTQPEPTRTALKTALKKMEYAQAWQDAAQQKRYALLDGEPMGRRGRVNPAVTAYENEAAKWSQEFLSAQSEYIAVLRSIIYPQAQAQE